MTELTDARMERVKQDIATINAAKDHDVVRVSRDTINNAQMWGGIVEFINKRKEEMYDGIVEQWHEDMDRAYEAQPESLKKQMRAARTRGEQRSDAMWAHGGEQVERTIWRAPPDVTAWGDDDPLFKQTWSPIDRNRIMTIRQRLVDRAKLKKVFNEAIWRGAVILWKPSLEKIRPRPDAVTHICVLMSNVWGENPPYIEVVSHTASGKCYDPPEALDYVYSIKPVWEL